MNPLADSTILSRRLQVWTVGGEEVDYSTLDCPADWVASGAQAS